MGFLSIVNPGGEDQYRDYKLVRLSSWSAYAVLLQTYNLNHILYNFKRADNPDVNNPNRR